MTLESNKWHHDIRITKDKKTSDLFEPYKDTGMVSKETEVKYVKKLYGDSFSEKSVLDVACNAGGHLFECQMFGIKKGFGFDARKYWINQAEWLKNNIKLCDTSNLTFKTSDMKILDELDSYDIVFFSGICYHLENPFLYLQKVADLTNDLLVINTHYKPGCEHDGLVLSRESKEYDELLAGVGKAKYGINWLPSGEKVLEKILRQYGFNDFSILFKNESTTRICIFARK